MTKIYISNDTYEVYLSSGKKLELTAEEMDEIAGESPMAKVAEATATEKSNAYERAERLAESILEDIKTLEVELMAEGRDVYNNLSDYLESIRNKAINI